MTIYVFKTDICAQCNRKTWTQMKQMNERTVKRKLFAIKLLVVKIYVDLELQSVFFLWRKWKKKRKKEKKRICSPMVNHLFCTSSNFSLFLFFFYQSSFAKISFPFEKRAHDACALVPLTTNRVHEFRFVILFTLK